MKGSFKYRPPFWLRNGHVQTVVPSLFRKINDVHYQRERIDTPDGDFLDLDWSSAGNRSLAIISHGLEGDSQRAYVRGMVKALNQVNVDCLAWNYRSCSGETNRTLRMYHNGSTDDLDLVIRHAISCGYQSIMLVGFSMGGNLNLLYLGQQFEHALPQIKGAATFSVPVDLANSAAQLSRSANQIYMKRFLIMLHGKVREKMKQFPDQIDDKGYSQIRNFRDFDDRYTAPLHGFKDAQDYWKRCSCKPVLSHIRVPALIVNAVDDPFLGSSCYPDSPSEMGYLQVETPKYGGHVGFMGNSLNGKYWSELRTVAFVHEYLQNHNHP